jgi:beta-galactosidase
MRHYYSFLITFLFISISLLANNQSRTQDFTENWKFALTDTAFKASASSFDDSKWRKLNLPHDWSIESDFDKKYPASPGGGALPGGLGWYRKSFLIDKSLKNKQIYVDFDGVYRNSEVWINGISVGKRPYGYISFRYDLTPFIKFGEKNVIAVRVDNSQQSNSRWYSGSGIYRNVWLTVTNPIHVDLWGTYITTPEVSKKSAKINIETKIKNTTSQYNTVTVKQVLIDAKGKNIAKTETEIKIQPKSTSKVTADLLVKNPTLWNIENPYLYKVITSIFKNGTILDVYETSVGIRTFVFDIKKGFILNGKRVKINGVCNHHDLGALGAAVNKRAIERQLQILKTMGCNGIRTSHNPPAPELLDLCDRMGFIVQDEAFDMWKKRKTTFDYSKDFPQWYERDLTDMIVRDRNHPSIFSWSIGNEVGEQWPNNDAENLDLQKANILLNAPKDTKPEDLKSGKVNLNALLTTRLVEVVKQSDSTRPVSAAANETGDQNPLFISGSLDIIGFNYHENEFADITKRFPTKPFLVSESVSSLQTRGFYLMRSDSMYIWPKHWSIPFSNPLQKCSAYDNNHAPWGTTHETTWKIVKKNDHIAGQYIWTGFDYLGEPTPYWWPSRSSYFGIIDLAGFPKDVYYMYQSEWTIKDMLYIFPHWNWELGKDVDVWAYYNNADEVELYLNGKSLGKKSKTGDDLHVFWRIPFTPGTLKAVSRKNGIVVLTREIKTAEKPTSIRLTADRKTIAADGKDLSFVTVELVDNFGTAYPLANQLVKFSIEGQGAVAGTDNGDQNDHNSLKKLERNLFFGKCLAIVQSNHNAGNIILSAEVTGFKAQSIKIEAK